MIEIVDYQECDATSKHVAIFSVYIPQTTLTIRNIKLKRSANGYDFLAFPCFVNGQDDEGKTIFTPIVEYRTETQKKFEDAIFEALTEITHATYNRYKRVEKR